MSTSFTVYRGITDFGSRLIPHSSSANRSGPCGVAFQIDCLPQQCHSGSPLRHMKARRLQQYRGELEPLTKGHQFLTKRLEIGRIAWVLLLFLQVSVSAVQAQYNYTTNNGALTITQYTGPGGAVIVPSIIKGLPVTAIGNFAFNSN